MYAAKICDVWMSLMRAIGRFILPASVIIKLLTNGLQDFVQYQEAN